MQDDILQSKWMDYFKNYCGDEVDEVIQRIRSDEYIDTVPFILDFNTLRVFDSALADDIIKNSDEVFSRGKDALRRYERIREANVSVDDIEFRVINLPRKSIRDITHHDLGNLIATRGIVQQATDPQPKFVDIAFECLRCGTITNIRQSTSHMSVMGVNAKGHGERILPRQHTSITKKYGYKSHQKRFAGDKTPAR